MHKPKAELGMSARPKVRSNLSREMRVSYEPLEKKLINFIDQDGNKKSISLISKEFNPKINCIYYYEPSFEEFNNLNQRALHSWLVNCRKFENMLSNLVNLPYFRFWSVMSYNSDVISALESYLNHASRSYRLHPLLKNNEIKAILSNIHKLIFKIFVRILLSKESEKNYITTEHHAKIVQDIIDIPKIISLLQLYGYGSDSEILRVLLRDFLKMGNENFIADVKQTCEDIVCLFDRYSEIGFELQRESELLQLYHLIANVTDILFSLHKLLLIESGLSRIYKDNKLIDSLLKFYCQYFQFVEDKCDELFGQSTIVENLFKFLRNQISLAQSCALLLFHHVFQNEFVKPVSNFSPNSYNQNFDALINVLNLANNQKRFCYDYFSRFLFEKEFESLLSNNELNDQLGIDDVLEYYKGTIKTTNAEYLKYTKLYKIGPENYESKKKFTNDISLAYQPEPSLMMDSSASNLKESPEIIIKEQMIREMFPDFGDGFIYKCLEHYDFDNEKVIDAILECNLPPHLESLNRDLMKSDLLKAMSALLAEQNNARGSFAKPNSLTSAKESVDVYIGKRDKTNSMQAHKDVIKKKTIELAVQIHDEEEEAKENVKTMMERGKLTKEDLQTNIAYIGLYDDEFDDTYENEDVSFDANDETFDDDDQGDDEEENREANNDDVRNTKGLFIMPNTNTTGNSGPNLAKPARFGEKFDNHMRYSKKQFYNKRNYYRRQAQTDDSVNHSGPPPLINSNDSGSAPKQNENLSQSDKKTSAKETNLNPPGRGRGNNNNFRQRGYHQKSHAHQSNMQGRRT